MAGERHGHGMLCVNPPYRRTDPRCLYKGALYLKFKRKMNFILSVLATEIDSNVVFSYFMMSDLNSLIINYNN
jgi:hypothetical protein